jgi:N-acetyl-gamma-glutamyl-phosphate reductase
MNKNAEIRVSVAGASGYTGGELLRYLLGHPQASIQSVLANSKSGQELETLFPNLAGFLSKTLETADWEGLGKANDLVFLCLPHGESQRPVKTLLDQGCKVIDLGADFRLRDAALYESTYGASHEFPELLGEAVYGMPELHREAIKSASLVANPGCYPTASTLALLPVLQNGALSEPPVIDAKSGTSGAGRGAKLASLYCEVNENFRAYGVGCHRHQPEIEQNVGRRVIFTPHLVPMSRGILATVYFKVKSENLQQQYREYYAKEPFVKVLETELPATKSVCGTNFCHLAVRHAGHPDYSVVISVIDNLGKGAAGTAIHNFNLMFDLPESMGLDQPAMFP